MNSSSSSFNLVWTWREQQCLREKRRAPLHTFSDWLSYEIDEKRGYHMSAYMTTSKASVLEIE